MRQDVLGCAYWCIFCACVGSYTATTCGWIDVRMLVWLYDGMMYARAVGLMGELASDAVCSYKRAGVNLMIECACMHACMYVCCMYVSTYVSMCMSMYLCIHVCMCVCMYGYIYIYIYVCVCACLYSHSFVFHVYIYIYICTDTGIRAYTYMCTHTSKQIQTPTS